MKKKIISLLTVLVFLFLSGCGTARYTKRYRAITVEPVKENCKLVRVSTFTIDISQSAAKNSLLQLSAQGQAEFIKEMGKYAKDADTLLKLLSKSISASHAASTIDRTNFKKRVVFTVEKQTFTDPPQIGPADRISRLTVKLTGLKGAKFVSWDKFDTEYDTVDLGDISGTDTLDLGGELVSGSSYATPEMERSLTEEVSLSKRYVVLGGHLEDKAAHLYQEGAVGIDLAGSFSVDFVFKAEAAEKKQSLLSLKNLWKDGKAGKAADIGVSFLKVKYPKSSEPISCSLEFDYILRRVLEKGETISESDDLAVLKRCRDKNEKNVVLIGKDKLQFEVYSITGEKDSALYLKGTTKEKIDAYFLDHNSAADFLKWLRLSKSDTIGKYRLHLSSKPGETIKETDIGTLAIKEKILN